jgi:hypothetical protein
MILIQINFVSVAPERVNENPDSRGDCEYHYRALSPHQRGRCDFSVIGDGP